MYFSMIKLVILLVLISCCVFKVGLCQNNHNDRAQNTNGQIQDEENSVKRFFKAENARFRRAIIDRDTCGTNSQCTGNETIFETKSTYYNCQCDNACYETFQDCCPDFVKTCGQQKKINGNTTPWKCVQLDRSRLGNRGSNLHGPEGIWMIQNCPRSWPLDETRTKCLNAAQSYSYPLEDFLPVVGDNKRTYRNSHCAVCNGETTFTAWEIFVAAFITPPENYNFDDKLRFMLANGGSIDFLGPGETLPRRYCAGTKYIHSCPDMLNPNFDKCLNGPVETVAIGLYYKNEACALCNGQSLSREYVRSRQGSGGGGGIPGTFSITFNSGSQKRSSSRVVVNDCPGGLVYDETLEYCREGLVTSAGDTLSDVFLVALWFQQGSVEISSPGPVFGRISQPAGTTDSLTNNVTKYLKSALVKNFGLTSDQIIGLRFHSQNFQNSFQVATFRLTLTPFQDFIFANQNNTVNISINSLKFLELLKFTRNFTIYSGKFRFPVIKLISTQLACFEGRTLHPHEYEVDEKTGNIFENTTGMNFSRNDYNVLEKEGGNVTICRRLVLSDCDNGAYVTLSKKEYFIFKNLTIFHYATNRTFNFGEYQISEGSHINRSGSFRGNSSFPMNSRIAVCLPFGRTFNTTEIDSSKSETSYALRILTLIGFSVSVFLLVFLLVTYGIFKELRTLPGLNLMSLCISMLLSHLVWLIGTAHFQDTTVCKVLGVFEHYIFLVSFMAMSVISHHSCVVFSQPFAITSNSRRRFMKYLCLVWITPAMFVAVCVSLDKTDTIFNVYGATCWLETDKAVLYLFLLPAAVLLVYNIYTFIRTALTLSRYQKDTRILQKDRKQNLMICAKLATLVGFPWLFAFFGVIFPDVEAFEYLFVIFVCLQGFYIGLAFVCNKKTLELYRKLWRTEGRNSTGSNMNQTAPTFQMS